MPTPCLILLSGPPGSGKTTFALALRESLDASHIESDAIRSQLVASPTHSAVENRKVFAEVESRLAATLAARKHAIFDATNLRAIHRNRFLELAGEHGAITIAVRLTAPEPVIQARLQAPRTGASTAGFEVYEQMRASEEPWTIEHLVVDTSLDIAPSVARVLATVEAA